LKVAKEDYEQELKDLKKEEDHHGSDKNTHSSFFGIRFGWSSKTSEDKSTNQTEASPFSEKVGHASSPSADNKHSSANSKPYSANSKPYSANSKPSSSDIKPSPVNTKPSAKIMMENLKEEIEKLKALQQVKDFEIQETKSKLKETKASKATEEEVVTILGECIKSLVATEKNWKALVNFFVKIDHLIADKV
jgi:hypothetical protein